MTERAAAIDRIRKLEARAQAEPNTAEGRNAKRLARDLRRAYGVTREEMRASTPAGRPTPVRPAQGPAGPAIRVRVRPGRDVDLRIGGLRVRWPL